MYHQHHSTHNPHGGQLTNLENVKITMTYVPAIEEENVETDDAQEEENNTDKVKMVKGTHDPTGQHLHLNNNNGEEDVIEGGHKKEDKTANLALEQNKLEILNGIVGRSTIYLLKPCHCTKDLIRELN